MALEVIPEEVRKFCTPAVLADGESFFIKIAETAVEVARAQQLRYDVFKEEQGRLGNIDGDQRAFIDSNAYDRYCIHLIVVEKATDRIVGTYRIQPGCVAIRNGLGFYSESEYHIEGLAPYAANTMEYGRSCVAPEHRNGVVISLLWAGVGEWHSRCRVRYMIGCVSIESVDPLVGWSIYRRALGMVRGDKGLLISGVPREKYHLPFPGEAAVADFMANHGDELVRYTPPLLKGYLRLGANVVGTPALDSDFGSIDFLCFMDLKFIPDRYKRHFMRDPL